eukprot:11855321-Alexandrium_andersonii.AAC.1
MSASLVGSEMCIRDRDRRKAPGKEALDGDSGSAKAVDSCALNLQHTHDPVSYTHLTLPTICSV